MLSACPRPVGSKGPVEEQVYQYSAVCGDAGGQDQTDVLFSSFQQTVVIDNVVMEAREVVVGNNLMIIIYTSNQDRAVFLPYLCFNSSPSRV